MQLAVVDIKNRVIRKITTDKKPALLSDEMTVEVADDFNIGTPPWKLDEKNQKVRATKDEGDLGRASYK